MLLPLEISKLTIQLLAFEAAYSLSCRVRVHGANAVQALTNELIGAEISLACDAWSSKNQLAFMGILGYYIDSQWKLQERLIGFEELTASHTGDYMAKILKEVVERLDIQDNIFAITTDNASNNNSMIRTLNLPQMDPLQNRIGCFAHIINLCVQGFMESLKASVDETSLQNAIDEEVTFPRIQGMSPGFPKTLAKVCAV